MPQGNYDRTMNAQCDYVLPGEANHMAYGSIGFDIFDGEPIRPLDEIRNEVALKTPEFMQKVIDAA